MLRVMTVSAALVLCAASAWADGFGGLPTLGGIARGPGPYQSAPVFQPSYQRPAYPAPYVPTYPDETAQQLQQLNHILGARERRGW